MAEIGEVASYVTLTDSVAAAPISENYGYETTSVSQFPQQLVQQKVWDTVAGDWVVWETEAIDYDGMSYPGPGTWGVHTSDFRLQNIKFTRV
jgi:hypothetical protein